VYFARSTRPGCAVATISKHERMKLEKDGLDVREALFRAAAEGWETLDDDDVGRLKWYGLYPHNTRDGHFMLRVKTVQGVLTADQAEALGAIAEDHGRGVIDCTTRQATQIHWIRLEDVPGIFERLAGVGLTTSGACGDITRNVVGCPLAGIGHHELVDGRATALAIHHRFLDNRLYSNLPRKYKISVTGCAEDCARGLINDLSLAAAVAEDDTAGFNVRVGGGLSSAPRFARWIDVFVTPEEAPEVVEHITAIFRDSDELRERRGKARLKFLVDRIGPDGFRDELERRVGRPLSRGAARALEPRGEDHVGVTGQRDGRHVAVGLCVPVGRLAARHLVEIADLARRYASRPEVRLTHQQNVLLPWIPAERLDALLAEPLVAELTPEPTPFVRGLQTCTGKEFCGLAKVFTKSRAVEIAAFLDAHVPVDEAGEVRVHFAGCSSSCAQHQIADIGIEGTLKRVDGQMIEAMDVRIGGRLGADPRFGEVVLERIPHWDLNGALLSIFGLYEQHRGERETFRAFAGRMDAGWWSNRLTEAAELDEELDAVA
jgi:ferredoxin-nitrite reductase